MMADVKSKRGISAALEVHQQPGLGNEVEGPGAREILCLQN